MLTMVHAYSTFVMHAQRSTHHASPPLPAKYPVPILDPVEVAHCHSMDRTVPYSGLYSSCRGLGFNDTLLPSSGILLHSLL